MDDSSGAFSFDFETALDAGGEGGGEPSAVLGQGLHGDPRALAVPEIAVAPLDRRNFRRTVCRHWLRGLCMKGASCGFLHQYDKEKMPVCRFFRNFGECREKDCLYKHTIEEIKECHMYMMGFCPNGPGCRFKHSKLPGPPPPVEEVLKKIQQLSSLSSYGSSNRQFHPRNASFNSFS
ncbi:30-kDa cleavage and polyadenylation specificity factor 30 [Dendrobium catenatum]|uniref:30-kDa cleavage and polyadenylation specificity factor 30 n=1 Tax=Dendrobium catenatum TaxID=906689 RepID=UPI0009F55777|nr:30-kDa cleavage and polyadenylation specificity factor 30 [Dendrobium catenatum]